MPIILPFYIDFWPFLSYNIITRYRLARLFVEDIMAYTSGIKSIEQHKAQGGKEILHARYKIANSKAEPGDNEFGTEFLETSAIKSLIEQVNREGMPMLLTIEFDAGYNTKFKTLEVPILPMCIEQRKRDSKFAMRYAILGSPEQTRELTQNDVKGKLYDLKAEINIQAEQTKEYIRRELIKSYLKIKRSDPKHPAISWVEGYHIVNKKYDISSIAPDQIGAVKLSNIYKELQEPHMDEKFPDRDFDAVYHYSKSYQAIHNGTDVSFVYGAGEHLVGLKKGRTPAEVEAIARQDAEAAIKAYEVEVLDRSIVDQYTHAKLRKNGDIAGTSAPQGPEM